MQQKLNVSIHSHLYIGQMISFITKYREYII